MGGRKWIAVVALVVIVLAIGSIVYLSVAGKRTAEKYAPKGTPETYQQMQKMPAAGGTP
jgi:uncharacterized membrane protein